MEPTCSNCGAALESAADACPNCGQSTEAAWPPPIDAPDDAPQPARSRRWTVAYTVGVVVAIGAVVASVISGNGYAIFVGMLLTYLIGSAAAENYSQKRMPVTV